MALSAMRARMGVGGSRMIVNAVGGAGRSTGNSANSFGRATLKVVGANSNIGGFGMIRRFSDIAGLGLPEQITANTTRFGQYCCALYLAGLLVPCGIVLGLSIVSQRRERRERLRNPRYDEDIKHGDVLQFGDKYVDAMDSQDQLVSQWKAADDRKLAQLKAEIAELRRAASGFDLRAEIIELREELLRAGTADEVLEIRERYDDLVEEINRKSSQCRAAAVVQLAEFKREITEVRGRIHEVEQKKE